MPDPVIEMMPSSFLLWRCLHGGPLAKGTIDRWPPDDRMPWADLRARNLPLLEKLTRVYGACAVVARVGDEIAGQLRFYPKAVCQMPAAGQLCLQQEYPYGPADDFACADFPSPEQITDHTLVVHCLMTGSPSQEENPYQRKGVGSYMVRRLIDWAVENGWTAIEATAYEDLPLIYEITGQAGLRFWVKLGFHIAETGVEHELLQDNDFTRTLHQQAVALGLPLERIKNKYTMKIFVSNRLLLKADG